MYNLKLEAAAVKSKLESINIPVASNCKFIVNSRAKRRWGRCIQNEDDFTIQVSSTLLDERNPKSALHSTIAHELLHTCPDCMNHGNLWQEYADKVTRILGITVKTKMSSAEKNVAYQELPKYLLKCKKCGHVFGRHRMCDSVKWPMFFHCNCGGELERIK